MTKTILMAAAVLCALGTAACSTSGPATPQAASTVPDPTPTPTAMKRLNPNVIEETETYYIERVPKEGVIRVDDRFIRHPLIGPPLEYFKEDDQYYYLHMNKRMSQEETALRQAESDSLAVPSLAEPTPVPTPPPAASAVSAADFADLLPPRVSPRFRLEPVEAHGLPMGGMWRSSFVVADMNGDKIPDIVSPPARIGGSTPRVWIGNGQGKFSDWPIQFNEGGAPRPDFSVAYGAVAVGDIDGDGKLDLVSASHAAGLASLFGDGTGNFAVVRRGLPGREFSSQGIVLLDADSDGKLDIVACRDVVGSEEGVVDRQQVRLYLFKGRERGWEYQPEGIVGGFYSNSLHAWDYDGDGKRDVLTGSHYVGALTLLWKNQGNGKFAPDSFPAVEIYAYHFATAPGTFGRDRVPAFVDAYSMFANDPQAIRATGLTVYSRREGQWARHRVWRKKDGNSLLNAAALGDLDGDGLDDVIFADSEEKRL
ncbi:MAG: VCBS repeat-containing protein, partial [Thermoanaerobaculia bacterium]|nr:VCBS repeat-containing protein [Thermoanaerobaculia bacterium]